MVDHGGKKISTTRRSARRPLDGMLFDSIGRVMRTTHASKSVRRKGFTQSKRYWYAMSKPSGAKDQISIERLPAMEIERLVLSGLDSRLSDKTWPADQITRADGDNASVTDILQAASGKISMRCWSKMRTTARIWPALNCHSKAPERLLTTNCHYA